MTRYGSICRQPTSNQRRRADQPCVVLCDLDGVVWLAHQPIPGSVEAIAALRAAGHRVLFVTNNSSARVEVQEAALDAIGIPAVGDVLTSAKAAALLIEPGERVLVCGGDGVVEASSAAVRSSPVATSDVTSTRWSSASIARSTTRRCCVASRGARNGARLIGTNDDATYPTPDGPIPGGGAILAAIVDGVRRRADRRRQAARADGRAGARDHRRRRRRAAR